MRWFCEMRSVHARRAHNSPPFPYWQESSSEPAASASVPQKLLQRIACLALAGLVLGWWDKLASYEVEVLAVVGKVLIVHQFGAPVATLLRHARIVADAVEADSEV
jgi:hypothetical protein